VALRRGGSGALPLLAAITIRTIAFALLWWVFAEGSLRYPLLAAGGIAAAVLASLWLVPPGGPAWRLAGFARFVPFFLRESLLGGLDVARRAFDPRLPIEPGFIELPLRLPAGAPRVFFVAVVSLLPGTLSTALEGSSLRVHVLDRRMGVDRTLRRLEERVAELYGARLDAG
jgi:multicomponent Na+:H+ antiporter subunit E